MLLTKKQFHSDHKFNSVLGANLAYNVANSEHAKQTIFIQLNALSLTNQIISINDYLAGYTTLLSESDYNKKVKQIKQWCSRSSIILDTDTDINQVSWSGGQLSIKPKDGRGVSSKSNGSTELSKEAKLSIEIETLKIEQEKELLEQQNKAAKILESAQLRELKALETIELLKVEQEKELSELENTVSLVSVKPADSDAVDSETSLNVITVDMDNLDLLTDKQLYDLQQVVYTELNLRGLKVA